MKTIFLKFIDEASARAALSNFLELTVDVVGFINRDGEILPGWHANVLAAALPEELREFEVFPSNPVRVFGLHAEPLRVPQEVSMGQCRLALFDQHGIEVDEQFFALVDQLPDDQRARALLELRTRPTVRRDNPLVVALGQAQGWDLDELFVYAGGL